MFCLVQNVHIPFPLLTPVGLNSLPRHFNGKLTKAHWQTGVETARPAPSLEMGITGAGGDFQWMDLRRLTGT